MVEQVTRMASAPTDAAISKCSASRLSSSGAPWPRRPDPLEQGFVENVQRPHVRQQFPAEERKLVDQRRDGMDEDQGPWRLTGSETQGDDHSCTGRPVAHMLPFAITGGYSIFSDFRR